MLSAAENQKGETIDRFVMKLSQDVSKTINSRLTLLSFFLFSPYFIFLPRSIYKACYDDASCSLLTLML